VLSSHGRGADELEAASPEFGSVARKVLASAKVPVHLVNPFQQ
jgi:nucleotide-binding universal stress UspA family protein